MEQSLGKRISANRKRLGLTQDQLAEKLGVTAQAVSKWENDQSCPDISVIPRLADIFSISTDELLGRAPQSPVYEGEIVNEPASGSGGKGKFEFFWSSGRKAAMEFALIVLSVGILYLLTTIFVWDISLWSILWPTALLIYGIFGCFPRFSFFRLGCALVGGYNLLARFFPLSISWNNKIILGVLILLFGISLFADAVKRVKKPSFSVRYTDENGGKGQSKNSYQVNGSVFTFTSSFGSCQQNVDMNVLSHGNISTSFGEFTVSLAGVNTIASGAALEVQNSFGELTILVPGKFKIIPDHSTAFASFRIEGQPDSDTQGEILVKSSVSFGETVIRYI